MGRYDGFEEFFEAQRLNLSRTALLLTGDRAAAEDLLQEALTRTAERWPRVIARGDPTAYIKQIMLNDVRSAWRRRRRTSEHSAPSVPDDTAAVDFTTRVDAGALLLPALRKRHRGSAPSSTCGSTRTEARRRPGGSSAARSGP